VYAEADIRSRPDAPAEIALGDRDEVLDFATRLEDASEVWLLGKSLDTITRPQLGSARRLRRRRRTAQRARAGLRG
jgi:hypothetical protein